MATSRILGPNGEPINTAVLTEEIAAPGAVGIRQAWHSSVANNLTPTRLAQILANAANGHAHSYLTLAEEMEERDLHYASVLSTRKLALAGLEVRVEALSDAADDVRIADAVRELTRTAEFGEMVFNLVDALGKSYAVSEIVWDRSGREWQPKFIDRDQRFFNFDRATGRELRLLDDADPVRGLPLPPYKFIVHTPKIRSGLPIRGGLARLAAVAYMCKAWAWRDWMAFADIYGMPMRIGRYAPNAAPADVATLIKAVANLGSDAAAVMPDSTRIELQQAAQTAGAGDFFDKLVTWWDKQVSKGVVGQTMTTDDGSSLGQAKVHGDVRLDILTADGRALGNTGQRAIVKPFVDLNFGPGRYPRISFVVPKPENIAALTDALSKLVPLGLKVEQSVVRDKLGLPDPAKNADVLMPPSVPATLPVLNRAMNVTTNPTAAQQQDPPALMVDQTDVLMRPAMNAWLVQIRALVDGAASLEEIRDGIHQLAPQLTLDQYTAAMRQALSVAALSGRYEVLREAGSV